MLALEVFSEKQTAFKAAQVRRLNTDGKDNYILLETEGKGHYAGCFLHLDTNEPGWWGEGDDMFFIDGRPGLPLCTAQVQKIIFAALGVTTS